MRYIVNGFLLTIRCFWGIIKRMNWQLQTGRFDIGCMWCVRFSPLRQYHNRCALILKNRTLLRSLSVPFCTFKFWFVGELEVTKHEPLKPLGLTYAMGATTRGAVAFEKAPQNFYLLGLSWLWARACHPRAKRRISRGDGTKVYVNFRQFLAELSV